MSPRTLLINPIVSLIRRIYEHFSFKFYTKKKATSIHLACDAVLNRNLNLIQLSRTYILKLDCQHISTAQPNEKYFTCMTLLWLHINDCFDTQTRPTRNRVVCRNQQAPLETEFKKEEQFAYQLVEIWKNLRILFCQNTSRHKFATVQSDPYLHVQVW